MSLSLASLFTDHMVLQRSKPVKVWGNASPGAKVAVRFAGQVAETHADASGKWTALLAPMDASAQGSNLVVSALAAGADSQPEAMTLKDVLVGEVWICSGQSNMQWPLRDTLDAEQDMAAAKYPLIRFFTVPNRVSDSPLEKLESGSWEACTPKTAEMFSAVGYYFGLEIYQKLNVPVGLINSSWGGTRIEAWTSRNALLNDAPGDASVAEMVRDYDRTLPFHTTNHEAWKKSTASQKEQLRDVRNEGYPKGWAGDEETTDVAWKDMTLPCFWRSAGLAMNGIVWFRKTVELPVSWAGRELALSIGAADKSDVTYFNNTKVGSLTMQDDLMAWNTPRKYTVQGSLVKAGPNVITVRVSCPSLLDEKPIAIDGVWRYAIETTYGNVVLPPEPVGPASPHAPARLHHAMIHPLVPYAMRGVIWYQGESNASRAVQYRTLSTLLIQDIRKQWDDQDIAFHLVQLANYMARPQLPLESDWAMLREAQTMTLATPGTGMAVTIDIGDANDIHPRNKKDVGKRLAYNALHTSYGMKNVTPCGPMPKAATVEGNAMRIDFDHTCSGLQVSRDGSGKKLTGFAIAASDKKFVWANATIQQGHSVLVSSEAIPAPAYMRYGWSDNPECNLYNSQGLPATPFRTDKD